MPCDSNVAEEVSFNPVGSRTDLVIWPTTGFAYVFCVVTESVTPAELTVGDTVEVTNPRSGFSDVNGINANAPDPGVFHVTRLLTNSVSFTCRSPHRV